MNTFCIELRPENRLAFPEERCIFVRERFGWNFRTRASDIACATKNLSRASFWAAKNEQDQYKNELEH
jgi:hypothetical protein